MNAPDGRRQRWADHREQRRANRSALAGHRTVVLSGGVSRLRAAANLPGGRAAR